MRFHVSLKEGYFWKSFVRGATAALPAATAELREVSAVSQLPKGMRGAGVQKFGIQAFTALVVEWA